MSNTTGVILGLNLNNIQRSRWWILQWYVLLDSLVGLTSTSVRIFAWSISDLFLRLSFCRQVLSLWLSIFRIYNVHSSWRENVEYIKNIVLQTVSVFYMEFSLTTLDILFSFTSVRHLTYCMQCVLSKHMYDRQLWFYFFKTMPLKP